MTSKFKKGDAVTIKAGTRYDNRESINNPPSGITGKVTRAVAAPGSIHPILVDWPNSGHNSYTEDDLVLADKKVTITQRRKELGLSSKDVLELLDIYAEVQAEETDCDVDTNSVY